RSPAAATRRGGTARAASGPPRRPHPQQRRQRWPGRARTRRVAPEDGAPRVAAWCARGRLPGRRWGSGGAPRPALLDAGWPPELVRPPTAGLGIPLGRFGVDPLPPVIVR